jgi:ribosomal protein L11
MRKRRAQFFAPAIKMIGVNMEDVIKDYEEYVKKKRRIKVDPEMIDENVTKKKVLYRSASTEALLRHKDVIAFEATMPLGNH